MFDCSTNSISNTRTFTDEIYDFGMNSAGTEIYITDQSGFLSIYESNLSDNQPVSFDGIGIPGKLQYSTFGKVYIDLQENNTELIVIELSTYTTSTINYNSNGKISLASSSCNPNNGLLYSNVFFSGGGKVTAINCLNNSIISWGSVPGCIGMVWDGNQKVYVSGVGNGDYIIEEYNSVSGVSNSEYTHNKGIGFRLDYNSVKNEVLSSNFREGMCSVFNTSGEVVKSWHTGGSYKLHQTANFGGYNAFLQQPTIDQEDMYNVHLSIVNTESNQTEAVYRLGLDFKEGGSSIHDRKKVAYNEKNNKLIVRSNNNNILQIIDFDDFSKSEFSDNDLINPMTIYSGTGDLLFIGLEKAGNNFEVLTMDMSTEEIVGSALNISTVENDDYGAFDMLFREDPSSSTLGTLYIGGAYHVWIVKYTSLTQREVLGIIDNTAGETQKMVLSNDNNYLVIHTISNHLYLVNIMNPEEPISVHNSQILDFTYNPITNSVFAISATSNLLIEYDLTGNVLNSSTIQEAKDVWYNSSTNSVFVLNDESDIATLKEYDINCNLITENSLIESYTVSFSEPILGFDSEKKTIYSLCDDLSSVLYPNLDIDPIFLQSGWNWMSFPRLMNRDMNGNANTDIALEKLNYFPTEMRIENKDQQFRQYDFNNDWTGLLSEVNSTIGYKLELGQFSDPDPVLNVTGPLQDPNTTLTLNPAPDENWFGYYLEQPSFYSHCLNQNTLDKIYEIKTQYWSIIQLKNRTILQGQITPFKYGELVTMKSNSSTAHSFQWNENLEKAVSEDTLLSIPETQYFSFEEKSDYVPYFIEFDESSDVLEVAVLADSIVVGASVRFPGDTMVHICCYLEGIDPNTELTIETWNGYKSSQLDNSDYFIYNHAIEAKEKRSVLYKDSNPFQWLSLSGTSIDPNKKDVFEIVCYPQPFTNSLDISYGLSKNSYLEVLIYNVHGKLIKTLFKGNKNKGFHSVKWNGVDQTGNLQPNGIYFCQFLCNGKLQNTQKIIKF